MTFPKAGLRITLPPLQKVSLDSTLDLTTAQSVKCLYIFMIYPNFQQSRHVTLGVSLSET